MMSHLLRYCLVIFILMGSSIGLLAQELLRSPEVDSSFVDRNYSNWSLRLFATYKYQDVRIRNGDAKVTFRPVDPLSAGLGFSYSTWVLDLGLRINTNTANRTQRLDFTTSALIGPHLLDIGFLYYNGFEEVTGNFINPFRDDVRTLTMNLDYLYFPGVKKTSYGGTKTGLGFQKQNFGSPLVGGFIERHWVKGDSALVPVNPDSKFLDEDRFIELRTRSIGVLFGYAQFIRLTDNFYGAAIITTGIGSYWGDKSFAITDDKHVAGAIFQLNGFIALGYDWRRWYSIVNYALDTRFINFGNGSRYNYNLTRIKFAVGYKLLKK